MDKIIEIIKFIVLGIVQGITEILPISSSAHLKIFKELFKIDNSSMTLEMLLHFASFFAVLIFYSSTIKKIFKNAWSYLFHENVASKKDFYLLIYLLVATIPAGIAGFLLKDAIEQIFANLILVGTMLIITGFILLQNYRWNKITETKEITASSALVTGIAQALGIVPGISRSGITISGARSCQISSEDAAKLSFLMFLPIALGGGILSLTELNSQKNDLTLYLIASISSGVFTFLALKFILKIIKKGKLHYFSFYCFIIGTAVIIWKLLS